MTTGRQAPNEYTLRPPRRNSRRKQVCDERATEYDGSSSPTTYDPRCRPWYQDAVEAGVIFTDPYPDAGTGQLTITVAAPVYDGTDATLLLGVVGMDVDLSDIENSIKELDLIGDEGYAYLLAPGGGGEVAVHKDLQTLDGTQLITELETGVDAEEFSAVVTKMTQECSGFETYSRDGSTWMMAWSHETVSNSGAGESDVCSSGGFIAVVTVSEAVLLEVSVRNHAMHGWGRRTHLLIAFVVWPLTTHPFRDGAPFYF